MKPKSKEDPHNKKKNHEPTGKGHKDNVHKKGDKQPQLEEKTNGTKIKIKTFKQFLEGRTAKNEQAF